MASQDTIRTALALIASNYGKHPLWVKDTLEVFAPHLETKSNGQVMAAAHTWIAKRREPPNVARFLELIEADPRTTPASEPTGCRACEDTGMRELAKWERRTGGGFKVTNYIAACDCGKGLRLSQGAYADYRDVVREWDASPYVDRVHVSDARCPKLPTRQRMDPETFDRLMGPKPPDPPKTPVGDWQQVAQDGGGTE